MPVAAPRTVLAAALWIALGAVPARAGGPVTLRHGFDFDPAQVRVLGPSGAQTLDVPGLQSTWRLGEPPLPFATLTFVVPAGSKVAGLRARAAATVTVLRGVQLAPASPWMSGEDRVLAPKPSAPEPPGPLGTDSPPAPVLAEVCGAGALHGYQLLSVRLYPVQFDAAAGRVTATPHLDLELVFEPGGAKPVQRERYSAAIEAAALRTLQGLVANPEALPGYDRRIGSLPAKAGGGFHPSDAPSLEGSDVDYVIITTDALAASWQVLADWKTRRGVPTVVRTVEWIQANYRRGSDLQETMRTFIRDAYAKWAVRYVLLGGDTDLLPARYGFSAFGEPSEQLIPADLYFGCLDGNWNKDGDGIFGEPANMVSDGDSTDLYAEVLTGRGPFSTPTEVAAYVAKVMTYENPVSTSYQGKALFLGEVLFPVDWAPGQAINLDGASFAEQNSTYLGACNSITKRFENYTAFAGASPLTWADAVAGINAGQGFVNHVGHGFRYNMSCGDRSYQNTDALASTNGDQRFVLYMLNCTATAFDFPCLAETFLKAGGGAVGVLGASRSAYAIPSNNYNRAFVQAVYQQGYTHLGEAFAQSRLLLTPNAWTDTADHYTHMIYNLLGDPELVFHTCGLGTTAVTHPASVPRGLTNVTVHVNVGGVARQGALVCLQKGTEAYQFGVTNGAGDAVIPFRAESAGTVQVAVSGQNMTTYLGTLAVAAASGAYVRNQDVTVDDNATGSSIGNSDGILDAGETIELSATFANTGSATASSLTGKLRIVSPWATVQDSTYSLSNISINTTRSFTNSVRFAVNANTPDGTVLPLTFVTTMGTTTSWTDVVLKVVHAPKMQLTLLDIDDAATGNNDGVIQAGETFDLLAYYKNFGTGAADGVNTTLATTDPDVVLTTTAVALGRINPMQELTGATRFRLRENVLAENHLTVTLLDNRGRSLISRITLRGPAAPTAPVLDASTGATVLEARWFPNAESDLRGYHLYRGPSSTGPWTRVSVDALVRTAYFRNTGLNPSTLYFYYCSAVDSSGNESPPSGSSSINTNPAQLTGWPIGLGASSSCTAATGDITGDGTKEIVAGNDHLYAWSANGIEVRDDDNDPQTWGVFANEVHVVTGAVALAEMDRSSPGLETFATSWDDSNKTFIVRGDGSMMPGWPQNPDFTTPQKGYWADAAAMDVDGDGLAEVWAAAKNGNLYAWRPNASPLGAVPAFKTGLGTFMRCSPSFANLDADPQKEIIFGAQNGVLNIWNADGTNFGTFPKTPGTMAFTNTAVGDVNHDGILDVVFITEGGAVNVYNTRTGNQLPGFPVALSVKSNPKCPSPALADFNFDGLLEIVVATNAFPVSQSNVLVLNSQGQTLPGWPILTGGYASESSPIVADVSGDGVPDILFGNEGGLLYGWTWTGQNVAGFPLTVNDFIRSVPTADDVDGDGGIDLVLMGWDQNLYIWDFTAPYNKAAAQWPTLKHDMQRSGLYGYRIDDATDTGPDADPQPARIPAAAFLAQNVPNPFNPTTRIQYGVPAGGAAVRLVIYDTAGRQVRELVRGTEAPGVHSALWDGRDDAGHRVSSGIFFYRLQVAGDLMTRKLVLLK